MNAKRRIRKLLAGLFLGAAVSAGPASAWDFDRTRAADIVDRAANDGNPTAQLLLAMAIDDRVLTVFDDLQFRLPATSIDDLYVKSLDPQRIYERVMWAEGGKRTEESLMAYNISAAYALAAGDYGKAAFHYKTAKIIGNRLTQQDGMRPVVTALSADAKTGEVAALRCSNKVPAQNTTYKIEKMLAGLSRTSAMAKDYREFVLRNVKNSPNMLNLDASGCWIASLTFALNP